MENIPSNENFEPLNLTGKEEFWWDSYENMECEEIRQFHSCLEELRKKMVARIASDGEVRSPMSVKQNLKEYLLVEQFVYQDKDSVSRGLGFKDGHFHTGSDQKD